MLAYGESLDGYAVGVGAVALIALAVRGFYLSRLFDGFDMARHAARAIAPTLPAAAAVLAARALVDARTIGLALAEAALYVALTALATWALERDLLREAAGYLRGPTPLTA